MASTTRPWPRVSQLLESNVNMASVVHTMYVTGMTKAIERKERG